MNILNKNIKIIKFNPIRSRVYAETYDKSRTFMNKIDTDNESYAVSLILEKELKGGK